ncbi:MAG TPA: LLM class flavin-dependent oxidoreductase [Candidatus Dormibacteraeota bacterium]|nr:LLM class flavin-dependent oxidoreductase [Candidatus Dormibacteraeota bacterium]
MPTAFGLDPDQGFNPEDELRVVQRAAELGYASAWTNSGPDGAAFERCLRWYRETGLPTGISAVPANGKPADFYATQARRLWDVTDGRFTLVVGSGTWTAAAARMREYLPELRRLLPKGLPLYAAALGPLMLAVAGELADGVSLNWCTPEQVAWSRERVHDAARAAGRAAPVIVEYIRTAVDPDPVIAQRTVAAAGARYLNFPAYRRHFERMGVAADLEASADGDEAATRRVAIRIGAGGKPGDTRAIFDQLAKGLDLPIVRVLVTKRGDVESAQRVLEECKPRH